MNRFSTPHLGFLLFCFFLSLTDGFSQDLELPSIIPPSPTAFQMTQYGDVPVNESTGKISPSIPLLTYQVGHLQLPISLNYQGNGVKVDQAASWTGINWNLNAGGVISRIIRDRCDLTTTFSHKQFYSYGEIVDLDNNQQYGTLNSYITNESLDTEVDIFNFSFPGYSGGFYFKEINDGEFVAYLTKNDVELKIDLVDGDRNSKFREIIITTPDGIKYYFGGANASEQSMTQQLGPSIELQTSFYLYKIKHPLGDEVYFNYDTIDYHFLSAISERYTKLVDVQNCGTPDIPTPLLPEDSRVVHELRTIIENGRFLKKIWSNNNDYEIILSSSTVSTENIEISEHYKKVLETITLRKSTDINEIINHISFDYLYPNGIEQSERFFLQKVNLFNDSSYEMVYNSPQELPKRFSYDQDHLGFYNGKGNSSYLPQANHSSFSNVFNTLADKSSVFVFSSLGTLTKLYYPTGGYTEFEYESEYQPPSDDQTTNMYKFFLTYNNDTTRNPISKNPNHKKIGIPSLAGTTENTIIIEEEIADQSIDIKMSNVYSTMQLDYHTLFVLKVYDITVSEPGNLIYGTSSGMHYNLNDGVFEENPYYSGGVYKYPNHIFSNVRLHRGKKYKIQLEIIPGGNTGSAAINANIDFNYDVISNDTTEEGIRIKRITDYKDNEDNNESVASIKTYYYGSGSESIRPKYLYETEARGCCGQTESIFVFINLVSSSINSLYSVGGNEKAYREVNIGYGGNGGISKEFYLRSDGLPINTMGENENYNLPNVRENRSVVNGTLKKETIINMAGYPLKETRYYYDLDDFGERFINNSRSTLYNACFDPHTTTDHLYLGVYETISTKVQLDSVVTKTFDYGDLYYLDTDGDTDPDYYDTDANGNGLADFLETGYNGGLELPDPQILVVKTEYEYSQHIGMPTKQVTSNSNSEESLETRYTYPETTTLNATYISEPLYTQSFKNIGVQQIPLSSLTKDFSTSGAFPNYNGPKSLLSQIRTAKGIESFGATFNPEERITYHDYDDHGNPIEVSKTDGTHIVYIWGYNKTQPIAKIENATYCYSGGPNQSVSNCLDQTDVDNLQLLSNQDIDESSEEILRLALNSLRDSLPDSMVTTYTYDPLIGITSVTDPRGQVIYYNYDTFNRLEHIKDKDGYMLNENNYRYQTQN